MNASIDLDKLEALEKAATPGLWYAHATDDTYCMNARYIGTRPSEFVHDNLRGLAPSSPDKEPPNDVIAITLLQQPKLANNEHYEENMELIVALRNAAPELIELARENAALKAEVERLKIANNNYRKILATMENVQNWKLAYVWRDDGSPSEFIRNMLREET